MLVPKLTACVVCYICTTTIAVGGRQMEGLRPAIWRSCCQLCVSSPFHWKPVCTWSLYKHVYTVHERREWPVQLQAWLLLPCSHGDHSEVWPELRLPFQVHWSRQHSEIRTSKLPISVFANTHSWWRTPSQRSMMLQTGVSLLALTITGDKVSCGRQPIALRIRLLGSAVYVNLPSGRIPLADCSNGNRTAALLAGR